MLCQIYGKLLTEKQFDYINDYYNNDLSLSEIAENYGITRQAARDNIKKGENKLFEYEEKLQIMKSTINTQYSDEKIAEILENIKNELAEIVQKKSFKQKGERYMAFEGLSSRLQDITRKLKGKARITETDLKEMLREVKLALLEADVNYKIVK